MTGWVIYGLITAFFLAWAAPGQPLPKFKTVSIAPTKARSALAQGKEGIPTSIRAGLTGKLSISNASLKDCITWAYDEPGYLVLGNGNLFPSRYDIEARTPVGVSANRYREMLQSLLVDWFHLKVHRGLVSTPAYGLTIAESGFKLHEVERTRGRFRSNRASLSGESVSMKQLAERLSVLLGQPVLDTTALAGVFRFLDRRS